MKSGMQESTKIALLNAATALIEESTFRADAATAIDTHMGINHTEYRKRARELRTHAKNLKDIVALLG
jgi:hypothetical protein